MCAQCIAKAAAVTKPANARCAVWTTSQMKTPSRMTAMIMGNMKGIIISQVRDQEALLSDNLKSIRPQVISRTSKLEPTHSLLLSTYD